MKKRYEQTCGIYTMVMIQDGDRVLLINRPDEKGFPGYIAPGGKVEGLETIAEGAVREVREETGLLLKTDDLIFKGMDGFINPKDQYRYVVFNYLATAFEGELLQHPPETRNAPCPVLLVFLQLRLQFLNTTPPLCPPAIPFFVPL